MRPCWLLVLAACDGGVPRPEPDPTKLITRGLSLVASDRSAPPEPGAPPKRPAGAVELANVGEIATPYVTADRTYWTTRSDDNPEHGPTTVLHWIPHDGDARAMRTLTTSGLLGGFAVVAAGLYVGGSMGPDIGPRDAVVFRVYDTKLEPIARMRSGRDTIFATALYADAGNLYWTEGMGRGHGRGPIHVTQLPSKATRRVIGCTGYDGDHADCPQLLREANLPLALRGDKVVFLGPGGATPMVTKCPCGTELARVIGDTLVCVSQATPGCPASDAALVPIGGGPDVVAGELADELAVVTTITRSDGAYYFSGTEGITRRTTWLTSPDELLVAEAQQFAVGGGMLVWTEGDSLWRAPLP